MVIKIEIKENEIAVEPWTINQIGINFCIGQLFKLIEPVYNTTNLY